MSSKTSNKKKNSIRDVDKRVLLLPLVLAIGLVPCIVHMYEYNSHMYEYMNGWFNQSVALNSVDVFAFWKYILIVILAASMVLITIYRYKTGALTLTFSTKYCFLFAYLGLSFLSAIFSKYKYFAWGLSSDEIFENIWVIMAYVIFVIYAHFTILDSDQYLKIMMFASIGLAYVMFIGFNEYIYNEPYKWKWLQELIVSTKYRGTNQLTFTFDGGNAATLFNMNNISYFVAILVPVYCGLIFADKNIYRKILWSVLNAFTLVLFVSTKTSTSIMAFVGTVFVGAVVLLTRSKLGRVLAVIGAIASAVLIVVVLKTTTIGQSLMIDFGEGVDNARTSPLTYIETLDDEVILHYTNGNDLHVKQNPNTYQIQVTDQDNKILKTENISQDQTLKRSITDERFPETKYSALLLDQENMIAGFSVTVNNVDWCFSDYFGKYLCQNHYGNWVELGYVEPVKEIFPNALFNGRGEIWNRLFTKIGKHIVVGSGPGTVMFDFPYENYINKSYIMGRGMSDVRAHSFFLQQWAENGLLSIICLIIFYAWYFIDCIKIYHKADFSNPEVILGFSVFLGVLGYMICNIAQDSQVHTASLMWIFTGIGLGFNNRVVEIIDDK